MQFMSPGMGNWKMVRQQAQPTLASGPSEAQTTAPQTYTMPQQGQQTGGQTLEELTKSQQQQQAQTMPLGQNYLRQFMAPASMNYFQQLY